MGARAVGRRFGGYGLASLATFAAPYRIRESAKPAKSGQALASAIRRTRSEMDGPRIRAWLGHASLDTTTERVAAVNAPLDCRRAGNTYRYTLKTNVPFPTSVEQDAGTELSTLCSWLPSPRWRGGRLAVSSMSVQNGFAASFLDLQSKPLPEWLSGRRLGSPLWLPCCSCQRAAGTGRRPGRSSAYGAFLVLSGVWWLWKDPAQLRERDRVAAT